MKTNLEKLAIALSVAAAALCTSCGSATSTTTPDPSSDSGSTSDGGQPRITITRSGVSPKALTVSPGTRALFTNNDVIVHDMNSDPHPEHTDCPEINQVGFLEAGRSRETGNLNTVRTCGYHDHNREFDTSLQGTITIR